MDDASNRGLTAIINIGHGAGYGSCGRNTAKEGRGNVRQSLSHQLSIGIVVVADNTICYSS